MAELESNSVGSSHQLAFSDYKTLITNGHCVERVANQLVQMELIVDNVIDCLPKLVDKCNRFESDAKHISDRWRDVSQMLAKHPQLLEVLEIPQLMDTCVRNGFYEESLQLYSYVQKLNKNYGQNIPIISRISKEVDVYRESMINQLMKEMSANIQLQNCLKIVGYLRQINKFSELELRVKFLSARDQWLSSIIKDIPSPNPLIGISKLIETNRVNLFDIVTQYRAIFADSDPIIPQKHLYYGITNLNSDRDFNDGLIINSWLLYKINQFLEVLSTYLNRWANNEFGNYYPIESVIDPSFYFGLSMSRIGADFRPQLVPIINNAICRRFALVVNEATVKFEKSIQSFTLTSHTINPTASALVGTADDQDLTPPISLLEFPLLAHYCNDILTAINEIRRVTPLMAIASLTNTLNESINRISNAISKYFRAEESGLTPDERQILLRFCSQCTSELLPYLSKCFERIVPMKSVADKLGVSLIEFNKVRPNFPSIDIESAAQSVIRLLPPKDIHTNETIETVPMADNIETSDTEEEQTVTEVNDKIIDNEPQTN